MYTNSSPTSLLLGILSILLSTHPHVIASQSPRDNGVRARSLSTCLLASGVRNFSMAGSPGYATIFDFSIQNLRFAAPGIRKPEAVVLPTSRRGLQRAVLCARSASLAIRVRSGGHSYEGQSYTVSGGVLDGKAPFVVIDLMNLNKVRVHAASATAWAESGATLGEVYHAVAHSSPSNRSSLALTAASCSTIGLGGHISGGGFGPVSRKFMLAADNVLDALLVDAVGRVLDRRAMGEDVFWAIRGGGGGSWGVVYAWKLRLVPVPDTVTVFTPRREGSVDAMAGLVYRWQFVGPALPDEFYLSASLTIGSSSSSSQEDRDLRNVAFTGLVLGPKEMAMSVLNERFPELGLAEAEVSEMSWVESAARLAGLSSVDELTSRVSKTKYYGKNKSDYVQRPISRDSLAAILRYLSDGPPAGYVTMDPYGGAMARLSATATPFPHRAGNLYALQYGVTWDSDAGEASVSARIQWLRSLYAYMTPHVSSNPRAAYVNYIDIDLMGFDESLGPVRLASSVSHARATWGAAYFTVENFDRLVRAKTRIDPANVFYNAQSIPLH
ncbi:Reticuline oxidase [Zea mays]|jgi:FAD/FMN-containing dehydrogenase|uniref:Reticuline oxidase n=2 Tax=Zea mays TaxID=4577 RepID=A0A3L6D761_MAIZE|nr:reticuline oxidase [Zea mays]XP_035817045.1 reticuline oxidase-like [Zea mays]XP_035819562.1 reticuline oxidase-like [Zea mays]PWZ04379.1 Reticuline oxidase [Zea mays]PWZ13196.1 Reticuline oxidase [Zea mays]|eukprot:XP_020396672.1 reticuline oxidase [Zea mays]